MKQFNYFFIFVFVIDKDNVDDLRDLARRNPTLEVIVEDGVRISEADILEEHDEDRPLPSNNIDEEDEEEDIDFNYDPNEEDSDVASLDHMSESDEELVQVRTNKIARKKGKKKEEGKKTRAGKNKEVVDKADGQTSRRKRSTNTSSLLLLEDIDYGEEEIGSEDHDSPEEDDDGELVRKKPKWDVYDPNVDMWKFEPTEGMKFADKEEFKRAMSDWSVAQGKSLHWERNCNEYVIVGCKEGCPFYIYASPMNTEASFQIKTFINVHHCSHDYNLPLAKTKWLSEKYHEKIVSNPSWKLKDFQKDVRHTYSFDATFSSLRRAKKMALGEVESTLVNHYAKVWDYAEEIKRADPETTVKVHVDRVDLSQPAYFKRFYCCFSATKKGWIKGCRPVIGMDGCFLKHFCKGQLLTAIGRDGNNQMFPIAWAVVELENNDSWSWFVELLVDDLQLGVGGGLTILSDQQKGLENAVEKWLPKCEHRFCARHVYANFRKKYTGKFFKGKFWAAAKTGTAQEFNAILAEIKGHKEHGPLAYEHLMKNVNPEKWARAFFMFFSKCDAVENNMCETFNGCILEARGKLLIYMLEEIRVYIIERMQRQRDLVQKWIDQELVLCPRIKKKLDIHIENSKYYHALYLGDLQYEVKHLNGSEGFVVDLRAKTCSCRRWNLSGLPCSHAVTCIFKKKDDVLDYIVEWYKVDKMKQAYDFYIKPLNGEKMWPKSSIDPPLPPQARRMPGRPKKQRRREQHEEPQKRRFSISRAGLVITCSRCKEPGHNKSSCKNPVSIIYSYIISVCYLTY